MKNVHILTLVVLVAFFAGLIGKIVSAESAFGLPDPGLTPESPIYFLDLWDEQARLFFARSDSSRVKRYRARVLERLSEAEALAGRGISATQRALELYRADMPFFYATAERLDDDLILADALGMASDHLDVLDHISERTDFEKKRFITTTKIFVIEQQLQSLHSLAKRDPTGAFRIFGDALRRRMARIREVAIDNQNNHEVFNEYAAYMAEADRMLRDWSTAFIDGLSPTAFLSETVQGHEETLLGPVRERIAPALENELLLAVNNVRKLSGKDHLLMLPTPLKNMEVPLPPPPPPSAF